jgi:hypothetical protein
MNNNLHNEDDHHIMFNNVYVDFLFEKNKPDKNKPPKEHSQKKKEGFLENEE